MSIYCTFTHLYTHHPSWSLIVGPCILSHLCQLQIQPGWPSSSSKHLVRPPLHRRGGTTTFYRTTEARLVSLPNGSCCSLTFASGSTNLAMTSGSMNRLTSQPHASRRNVRSCHNATNEKMRTVVKI